MLILFQFEKTTIYKYSHFELTTTFSNIIKDVMIYKEELNIFNKTFDNFNASTDHT